MTSLTNTIAGQLISRIIAAILLSQILIVFVFYYQTDEQLDAYEDRYMFTKIASVYNKLQQTPDQEQLAILDIASDSEFYFSLSPQPKAEELVHSSSFSKAFFEEFGDMPIYISEDDFTSGGIFNFFISTIDDDCLIENDDTESQVCAEHILSIKMKDGQWLNIESEIVPYDMLILLSSLIASAFVTFLGVVVVVVIVVKRVTAPLKILSSAADKLGKGETINPLKAEGPRELLSTINAFNMMQERLTRFIQDRTNMLAAISHDLRTPITSLRLRAEFIEDDDLQKKMVKTLEDMQVMVEACLAFAKQDFQEEESKTIDLVEILKTLADESAYITFSSSMMTYNYTCRSVSIKRAVRNLLENAVKYGSKAHLSFEHSNNHILITIQDQGQGIPEDKLTEVFEPFIRLDEARNTESCSVGLGLSIARTIIHKHGGDITAINTNPGLKMIIKLPA